MQKFCRARLKKKKEEFDRDSCIDGVNSFPWVSRVEWPHVRVYRS